jgi:hypothetical protein
LHYGILCYIHGFTFDNFKGHCEKGSDEKSSWIDFIFYKGVEQEFDLTKINKAVMGFTFSLDAAGKDQVHNKAEVSDKEGILNLKWEELILQIPMKPQTRKSAFI